MGKKKFVQKLELISWISFWVSWIFKELWLAWCSDTNEPPYNLHTYLQFVPFDLSINANESGTITQKPQKPQTRHLRSIWGLKTRKCAKSVLIPYLLYISDDSIMYDNSKQRVSIFTKSSIHKRICRLLWILYNILSNSSYKI